MICWNEDVSCTSPPLLLSNMYQSYGACESCHFLFHRITATRSEKCIPRLHIEIEESNQRHTRCVYAQKWFCSKTYPLPQLCATKTCSGPAFPTTSSLRGTRLIFLEHVKFLWHLTGCHGHRKQFLPQGLLAGAASTLL